MHLLFAKSDFRQKTHINNISQMPLIIICSLLLILFSLTALPALSQMSTTGPTRPPGVDNGLRPMTRAQVVIPGVPIYLWQHGCGPTSLGMIIGYYDSHGSRHLVEGTAAAQTAQVNDMIAQDNGNTTCDDPTYSDHYRSYACPKDNFNTLLPDKSELGGAHANNCLGDFMGTSRSIMNLMYGWSYNDMTPVTFNDYIDYVAPQYTKTTEMFYFYEFTWENYKAEIDAGRPTLFHLDTDADNNTDHMVVGLGYEETGGLNYYACYDTWDNNIHWYQWREMSSAYAWGINSIVTFDCYSVPKTIHVPLDYLTIGEAIEAADEGDTILVADGIYSGPGNRDLVLEGAPILLSENGPEVTIIDCGGSASESHTGIIVGSGFGSETKIDGFTIRNGYCNTIGAGINCANSMLTISNCIFENNHAYRGGALSIYGSTPIIDNCIFRQNSAVEGGAVYFSNWTAPTFNECLFENNEANSGGAIYSYISQPIIQNTIFSKNTSNYGGAYYLNMLGGSITNSNFCMNTSSHGAAIFVSSNGSGLVIDNCIIAFNMLSEAIDCSSPSNAPVINCTDIFGHDGGDWAGGISEQETVNNNFCGDPIFCDIDSDDYSIHITSPCTPDNSNCGSLVGVLDVACTVLFTCGDANNDEAVNILDIVHLINYKYKNGPEPVYFNSADVNSDSILNILDIVVLINYKYKNGTAPACPA